MMNMEEINIVSDLAQITTIQDKVLEKLFSKMVYCISDAVVEAKKCEKELVDLNIGIGNLSIQLYEDSIKYKFVPSQELESSVKDSILEERNLLEDKLEQSFVDKIVNLYKDLL